MEDITLGFILNGLGSIGSFLIGISAIFGLYKYFRNQAVANETLYGEEAEEIPWSAPWLWNSPVIPKE